MNNHFGKQQNTGLASDRAKWKFNAKSFNSSPLLWSIIWFFLLFIIFDGPIFNFLSANDLTIAEAFINYNYKLEHISVVLFWIVSLILFPLLFFRTGSGHYRCRRNTIYRDLIYTLGGIYYLYVRNDTILLDSTYYTLASFSILDTIQYLDIILLIPALSLVNMIWCFSKNKKSQRPQHTSFWIYDKPIETINDEYEYSYKTLIEAISGQIKKTADDSISFTIGIKGPWGCGKTTFLNVLKTEIEKEKSNLIMDFNPWLFPDETNLSRAFLNELGLRLSPYSFRGNYHLIQLIKKLYKDNSTIWGVLANAICVSQTLDDVYKAVKQAIISSKKRIVVFIDDIDRLQVNEIYEILTIIRNIGNLPNTIFILAYDKDYLLDVMSDKFIRPQEYLAKFFQAEYPLGKIRTDTIIYEIAIMLGELFPEVFKKDVRFIASSKLSALASPQMLVSNLPGIRLIKNKRDIKRLMNNIRLLWPIFRGTITELDDYFSDFLKIEILRLKYGNVFSKVKYMDGSLLIKKNGKIILSPLAKYRIDKLVIEYNDRIEVLDLLRSLFQETETDPQNFSIRNADFFDYYFLSDSFAQELTTTTTTTLEDEEIQ